MRALYALPIALFACAGNAEEAEEEKSEPVEIEIVSPEHGSEWSEGDDIHLEVSAKQGKAAADVDSVVWTVGDREVRGASTDVGNLDPGNYDVVVDVVVGDKHYGGRVGIVVNRGEADADTDADADADADADVTPYAGTMDSHVWLSGDFDYDASCPGTVSFTVSSSGTIAGTGQCRLDGDYDMAYDIEGTVSGRNLSGDMIMVNEGTEYRTPFTGSGAVGDTMNASFDKTFRDGGNELRLQGSWTASPQ